MLEPLEFLQPILLSGLLFGLFPLGLHLLSYVAGGGNHAKGGSVGIAVDRGVVQDFPLAFMLVDVAQGQRGIDNRPLLEDLLVDLFCLLGVGEVVGEGGPDELVSRDARELDHCLVGVGDLAVRADRHQRLHGCLNQAPRILSRFPLAGHVTGGGEQAEHVPLGVSVSGGVVQHFGDGLAPVVVSQRQLVVRGALIT